MPYDHEYSKIEPPKPKWEEKPPLSVEEEISLYRTQTPQVRAALLPGFSREAQTLLGPNGQYAADAQNFVAATGRMQEREHRTRAGHLVTERVGHPRGWMEKFMSPIRHQVVSFRGNSQSEAEWQQQSLERQGNIAKYNSPTRPSQVEFDAALQKVRNG